MIFFLFSLLLQLENIAVTLWNKTVVMKMKGSLSCDAIAKCISVQYLQFLKIIFFIHLLY